MLFSRLLRRPSRSPAIPDSLRVYAVGDIHGRLDLLEDLLARIEADQAARPASKAEIIFLGDLVDRGPDSRGVIDRLLTLSRSGGPITARFIKGNHDDVFLRAAQGDTRALRALVQIGGRATLLSYGISEDDYEQLDYPALADWFTSAVPPEHVAFLASFDTMIEIGDYLFVHAGVRPGVPTHEQHAKDLLWIRDEFLNHRGQFEKMIVHGHNVREEVEIRPNRIGIDTGAYASGRLTALALEGTERWTLCTA